MQGWKRVILLHNAVNEYICSFIMIGRKKLHEVTNGIMTERH